MMSIETMSSLAGGLVAAFSFFKIFCFIGQGEKGVKMFCGKVKCHKNGKPIILEPGLILMWPFIEKVRKVNVMDRTYQFPKQEVSLMGILPFQIRLMAMFKVVDVYKAMFLVEDFDNSIDDLCMGAANDEFSSFENVDDFLSCSSLSGPLISRVRDQFSKWGVEILQLKLTECRPASAEATQVLSLKYAVAQRFKALEDECQKRGLKIQGFDPALAAALIGTPLVTSVSTVEQDEEKQFNALLAAQEQPHETPSGDGDAT